MTVMVFYLSNNIAIALFVRINCPLPHIHGKRGYLVKMSVTKTGVHSYDGLTEGGNF